MAIMADAMIAVTPEQCRIRSGHWDLPRAAVENAVDWLLGDLAKRSQMANSTPGPAVRGMEQ
jgi:hypothetical protein